MGLLTDIFSLRAYAQAKAQIDAATEEKDMPSGPAAERVWEVEYELMQRRNRAGEG